jgi:hypothetical protein
VIQAAAAAAVAAVAASGKTPETSEVMAASSLAVAGLRASSLAAASVREADTAVRIQLHSELIELRHAIAAAGLSLPAVPFLKEV